MAERIPASDAADPHGRRGRLRAAAPGFAIGIVLGLSVALVALGMGRGSGGPVSPEASSGPVMADRGSVSVLSPGEETIVVDSPLHLTAVASRPLGVVHVELAVGARVLGAADVTVDRAGQFRIAVPLTGPSVAARARLTLTLRDARGSVVLDTRTVQVCTRCA